MRSDRKNNHTGNGGRPSLLCTIPEHHGGEDEIVEVNAQEVAGCQNESSKKGACQRDHDMFDLCCILMD